MENKNNKKLLLKTELTLLENWEESGIFEKWREEEEKQVPIENMEFSVRTYRALKRAGYWTLKDIISHSEKDLMRIRNLGVKCMKEIVDKIESMGLSLSTEKTDEDIQYAGNFKKGEPEYEAVLMERFQNWRTSRISEIQKELIDDEELDLNKEDIGNFDIEHLNLSLRTLTCLKRAGCDTVSDLLSRSKEDLGRIRNMGQKGIKEIFEKLSKFSTVNDEEVEKTEVLNLEDVRLQRDNLQEYLENLQSQIVQAQELLNGYDKLLGEDKDKSLDEE